MKSHTKFFVTFLLLGLTFSSGGFSQSLQGEITSSPSTSKPAIQSEKHFIIEPFYNDSSYGSADLSHQWEIRSSTYQEGILFGIQYHLMTWNLGVSELSIYARWNGISTFQLFGPYYKGGFQLQYLQLPSGFKYDFAKWKYFALYCRALIEPSWKISQSMAKWALKLFSQETFLTKRWRVQPLLAVQLFFKLHSSEWFEVAICDLKNS